MTGYTILNFGLRENGFYEYGTTMPIEAIDKILEWRDKEYGQTVSQSDISHDNRR
jgi:hypothetical protein